MTQLKVLHFLADGRVGGPQVRIVRIHAAMNNIGCPVETIVVSPATQPENFFNSAGMQHVEMTWHKPVRERPFSSGMKWFFSGIWRDVASSRKLIAQFKGAVPHINGAIMLPVAIAASLGKEPWAWHFNDTSVPRFLALIVKFILYVGGGMPVASSHAVVSYYGLPDNTRVLYPPVGSVTAKACIDGRGDVVRIGMMANLSPGKGIEDVIEAFAIAQKERQDIRLLIAGRVLENKRWYFESMQQRVIELGIADKVEFCGFVSDPLTWMSSIDIFVFSSYSEAAGLALIEAMASGLPVVLADVPATREILGGCGILTPLGDADAMADAIVELAGNPALRRELGEKAEKRGRSVFSAGAIARQYCEIYSEILRGK